MEKMLRNLVDLSEDIIEEYEKSNSNKRILILGNNAKELYNLFPQKYQEISSFSNNYLDLLQTNNFYFVDLDKFEPILRQNQRTYYDRLKY